MSKKLLGLLILASFAFCISCQDNKKSTKKQHYRFDKKRKRNRGCPSTDKECCDMQTQKNENVAEEKVQIDEVQEKNLPAGEISETVDNSIEIKDIFDEEDKFEFNN